MDDDDKTPEDEASEPARDAVQEEGAELRKVPEEELKRILADHPRWLETDGKEGKQADLSRTDLQGANLNAANLQKADLRGANLQKADLVRANLQGAFLQSANLTKAKGLTGEQLDETCGNDRTQLPDNLADYQMKPCP